MSCCCASSCCTGCNDCCNPALAALESQGPCPPKLLTAFLGNFTFPIGNGAARLFIGPPSALGQVGPTSPAIANLAALLVWLNDVVIPALKALGLIVDGVYSSDGTNITVPSIGQPNTFRSCNQMLVAAIA